VVFVEAQVWLGNQYAGIINGVRTLLKHAQKARNALGIEDLPVARPTAEEALTAVGVSRLAREKHIDV